MLPRESLFCDLSGTVSRLYGHAATMYARQITMAEFANINDRMEVSAREIVGPTTVTTGECPGLGSVIAIQTDQGVMLLSEIHFMPPGYNARSALYRNPGSPLTDVYAWN